MSPPSRWSGLKSSMVLTLVLVTSVSTLAVEWIEICSIARMWGYRPVSTLAVEWIEIDIVVRFGHVAGCLHPRGGVD